MLNLLFPLLCNGCSLPLKKGEKTICARCRHHLPLACHHRNGDSSLKEVFYGRIPVFQATALMEFHKEGVSQNIIHNLKYRRQEGISAFLGEWLGAEVVASGYFQDVDLVIPVPIHPAKKRKRGYNQVSGFARKLAEKIGKPCREDILLKKNRTVSQVLKSRSKRFRKHSGLYLAKPEALRQKHILIVDDIVTTGATIEECAGILLEFGAVNISIAVMAKA